MVSFIDRINELLATYALGVINPPESGMPDSTPPKAKAIVSSANQAEVEVCRGRQSVIRCA